MLSQRRELCRGQLMLQNADPTPCSRASVRSAADMTQFTGSAEAIVNANKHGHH